MDETAKKIILITGANSGIGKQTAIGLAYRNNQIEYIQWTRKHSRDISSSVSGNN
jgi:NADP-dependent 3-hydroxy acid dehydrogenase YdfG